ncbi:hypothetical protein DKG82_13410 [Salmonella enterica subsp. enterica serovar Lexington]|nr:hypothetical protein [Salmonella enterica subsp. enterica serovar Lexington]EAA8753632.1 hypothetical protein [Salmonella enterica subsp. enterica serovar Weltevreden]EAA9389439.1 hypothetical protein [Salmonella enterica subsp. enterica]EAM2794242.1 hypothetical protein [Salmonella enterica]ECE0561395.1 hypothetical protein [Salmonella enterica subsp. enterica serovar Richmond]
MGSNIIELAKLGHERAAELKASCGAVDVRSLAQLISDLATQLEVQFVRSTNMAVQLANAESKCRELAAELSAVDKIHNEAVFITDDHYEQCPPKVQKMIRSLAVLQIPTYDAFLAEVREQGVDEFLRGSQLPYQIATVLADYDNVDDATLQTVIWSGQPPEPDGDVWHLEYVSRGNAIVRAVLKELRKGASE